MQGWLGANRCTAWRAAALKPRFLVSLGDEEGTPGLSVCSVRVGRRVAVSSVMRCYSETNYAFECTLGRFGTQLAQREIYIEFARNGA